MKGPHMITRLDLRGLDPTRCPRNSGYLNLTQKVLLLLWAIPLVHISSLPISWAAEAPLVGKIRLQAFSPDNSQLFVDYCDAERCRVAAVALRTGAITLFTPKNLSHELNSPSLSYDGRQLAVVITDPTSAPATSQIGILDLQKKRYRVVTRSPTFKEFPSFAPDGTKIIFAQSNRERREGKTRFSKWDIYEVDIRTGTERRLTDFCFFLVGRPQYLPDGKTFLFSGEPTCNYPSRGSPDSHIEYRKRYQDNTIFRMVGGETTLEPLLVRGRLLQWSESVERRQKTSFRVQNKRFGWGPRQLQLRFVHTQK